MSERTPGDLPGDLDDALLRIEALERLLAAGLHDTVSGRVSSAGAIVSGTGFTVTKGIAGVYSVQFVPVLSATPAIVATADVVGGSDIIVTYGNPSATAVNFNVYVVSVGLGDRAFSFIARV